MTSTTYTIATAPKNSEFYAHDCLICGHSELTKPIWLRSSAGTLFPAGTTCAAKAIYGSDYASIKTRVRNAYDAAQRKANEAEELRIERMERFARALAVFNVTRLSAFDADLASAQKTFHAMKPAVDFPTYMAQVAATGTL
jgi:hypothetical protein